MLTLVRAARQHKQLPVNANNALTDGGANWIMICQKLYGGSSWDNHKVMRVFQNAVEQIDLVQEDLEALKIPVALYHRFLHALRGVFVPEALALAWDKTQSRVGRDENLIIWEWIAIHLGEDETPLDPADLNEIVESLQALEAILAEEGVPTKLRRFLKARLADIWQALDMYPLAGGASLQDAMQKVAGSLMLDQENNKALRDPDNPAVVKVREAFVSVCRKTASALHTTTKFSEGLNTLSDLYENVIKRLN
ncbi:MAG: hypothetical protein E2591_00665 [Achromobacter sp.]|uniref:hypothetical protein n=1 Tax=Achromobacter sp. TaxID=134375 RepID=UPI0012D1F0B3|nr:hypothetical protein [Achromobacter sp.]